MNNKNVENETVRVARVNSIDWHYVFQGMWIMLVVGTLSCIRRLQASLLIGLIVGLVLMLCTIFVRLCISAVNSRRWKERKEDAMIIDDNSLTMIVDGETHQYKWKDLKRAELVKSTMSHVKNAVKLTLEDGKEVVLDAVGYEVPSDFSPVAEQLIGKENTQTERAAKEKKKRIKIALIILGAYVLVFALVFLWLLCF